MNKKIIGVAVMTFLLVGLIFVFFSSNFDKKENFSDKMLRDENFRNNSEGFPSSFEGMDSPPDINNEIDFKECGETMEECEQYCLENSEEEICKKIFEGKR